MTRNYNISLTYMFVDITIIKVERKNFAWLSSQPSSSSVHVSLCIQTQVFRFQTDLFLRVYCDRSGKMKFFYNQKRYIETDSRVKPDTKKLQYSLKTDTCPACPCAKTDSSAQLAWCCCVGFCTTHKVLSGFI